MPRKKSKSVLIINGALGGVNGNTSKLLNRASEVISDHVEVDIFHLVNKPDLDEIKEKAKKAKGFIFSSGVYWMSWGSPLQLFLERTTSWEAENIWIGKPAGVIITMHAFGGMETMSRLQGVLTSLGMMIPPLTGVCYSFAMKFAEENEDIDKNVKHIVNDFYDIKSVDTMSYNLIKSIKINKKWERQEVDTKSPYVVWVDK